MKVLVLGAAGQVARAVAASTPAAHQVLLRSRAEVDITSQAAVAAAIEEGKPDWVVNGAAYTAVDRAETDRAGARAVNDVAVGVVAEAAVNGGCRFFHLSTDFVFDGTAQRPYQPGDSTNPQSVYAETKLAGEYQALRYGGVVLRTAWVYASQGRNFVLTMLYLMREKPEVRVVADQIGTPTWATGIARAIWGLMDASAPSGIYHWTDSGVASWYDFAVAIQDEALARGILTCAVPILPISTKEYPTPARRPAYSVLNTDTTRLLINSPALHWRHNLRNMLDELRAS